MPPPSGSRRLCFKFLPHVFQKRRMIKNVVGVRSSNFLSQTIEIWIVSGSLNCQIFTLECIMLLQTRSCAAFVRVPSPFDLQELIKSAGIGFIRPYSGPVNGKDLFFHKSELKKGPLATYAIQESNVRVVIPCICVCFRAYFIPCHSHITRQKTEEWYASVMQAVLAYIISSYGIPLDKVALHSRILLFSGRFWIFFVSFHFLVFACCCFTRHLLVMSFDTACIALLMSWAGVDAYTYAIYVRI